MPSQADLAKIHIAKKDLHLTDEAYRDIIRIQGGAKSGSAADLSPRGVAAVLGHFRRLGWKATPGKKAQTPERPALASDPQSRKIRAQWIELYQAGVVRDPSEKALAAYVQRMTKSQAQPLGVAALQWCTSAQKHVIIEALKKWLARTYKKVAADG